MSDTITETDWVTDLVLGDERLHVSCCQQDKFFCGRDFHQEAMAQREEDRDDCCRTCVEISDNSWCPPVRPTHAHCPVPGPLLGRVCPE